VKASETIQLATGEQSLLGRRQLGTVIAARK
jgi:hypothetical protein